MRIIRPNKITNSMVTTNVPELYPNWSSGTTYALGAKVVFGDFVYESLQAGNLNKQPDTQLSWWVVISSSQKMAAFDGQLFNVVESTNSIVMTITPGTVIDAISYFGILGAKAKLEITDGGVGPNIFEETIFLNASESTSWYQYFFFDPFLTRTQVTFTGLPPVNNPHIKITIERNGDVKLAEVVMGRLYNLGVASIGANSGIVDYSRKDTDEFGNVTFVRRAFSKRVECQVLIDNVELNRVQRVLYDVRATPITWIVSDNPQFEEPMVVYGFYRDFTTQIAYPTHSLCNIEIEGLI